MTLLIVGLALFFATHAVSIINEPWRDRMVARIGLKPWKGFYSVIAIVGFLLIVRGYSAVRVEPIVLYTPPAWLVYVSAVLMLFVFPLLLASFLPGRIRTAVKHPLLAATKTWALAHLLTNGTLADVLLFGGFLIWAAADRISLNRRAQRPVPAAPATGFNDLIAVAGGLTFYALFVVWAHQAWFGVGPI